MVNTRYLWYKYLEYIWFTIYNIGGGEDGSRQKKQGITLATNSFTYQECVFLSKILTDKFYLKTSVIKAGHEGQWKISIWKQSMPHLVLLVKPFIIDEMKYKLQGYL
jgi:hypothetical protein